MDTLFEDSKRLQSWWRGRSVRFWLAVSSPLLIMGACGWFAARAKQAESRAEREAAVLHQRLEAFQYDVIYEAAAPAFRAAVPKTNLYKYLAAIREKSGACRAPAQPVSYFANSSTSGTTVNLRYHLECANGALDEAIAFDVQDGAARLLHYQASSPFQMK